MVDKLIKTSYHLSIKLLSLDNCWAGGEAKSEANATLFGISGNALDTHSLWTRSYRFNNWATAGGRKYLEWES